MTAAAASWIKRSICMKYAVIVEQGECSYGAYVPDLPGCIAVGETREETLRLIHEAIELHIENSD